jgi:hypothetical protein
LARLADDVVYDDPWEVILAAVAAVHLLLAWLNRPTGQILPDFFCRILLYKGPHLYCSILMCSMHFEPSNRSSQGAGFIAWIVA